MVVGCVWTGYVLRVELPVQKRPCPIFVRDVVSPGIHECFRGLTSSQRTSGIWGVTDPLPVTICSTFSSPTSLITSFNKPYMYLLSLVLSNASIALRKIMFPFEYTMKLIMLNLVGPIHPSHIILHPYVFHFSLCMLT